MSLNILVVDDSAVMRSMVIKTLRAGGVELGKVHQAANGREGLDVLEQHWVDMVLVDINMPVMNGQQMLEQIRANPIWENMPVIVVSTEGSQTRIDELERMGARFIHKPFTPELVREMIQNMTGVGHAQ